MSTMMDLRFKCEAMRVLQEQKEALEEQLSGINKQLDDMRQREIPQMMNDMGVANATFDTFFADGRKGRVQLAADIFMSTNEGKKEDAMTWLRDCGYGGLIQETYNASSVKAIFRQMIVNGTEIPEDIFKVTPFQRASIVRA